MTLPDGRRTTFRQIYTNTTSAADCPSCLDAVWIAPPGVTATLTTPNPATKHSSGDNTLVTISSELGLYWQAAGSFTPFEAFDFPKWILTTQDGTQYEITRDQPGEESLTYIYQDVEGFLGDAFRNYYIKPHPGKPRLTKIVQRSGDSIQITDSGLFHYNATNGLTRSVFIEPGNGGRIIAIRDPISGSNGVPVVKYIYNDDTGNLIQVHKLVDRAAVTYATNRYHYDHAKFLHFITAIDDAIGNPITRNEYDDNGRLIKNIDANGNTITYVHNLTNKIEQIVDRLGKTNTFVYDNRGNVTTMTNAIGEASSFAYDDLNNKTNEIVGGIQTSRFVYDSNSFLLQSVLGDLQTNVFTYNSNGQVLTSMDGRGNATTTAYDSNTGNLLSVVTALSTNTYLYDGLGRLISETDSLGTITTNKYDQFGNVTNVAVFSGATELSRTSYTYDENNNRKTQSVKRTLASQSATEDVTTYVYDGQSRVIQNIEADGKTNFVVFNLIGMQQATIDKLGHTNFYFYDARGSLTNITYPDTTPEQYLYDAEGRRTNTIDRAWRTNTFIYDALGRLTTTIFPDNVSSNVTVYGAAGRVFQTIDARGTISGFKYDAVGRRIAVTNAVGTALTNITSFAYDAAGNQTNMVDNLGRTNSYFHDALNRRTNVTLHDGSKIVTQYDPVGRRIAETDQATNTTKFAYDGLGRLTLVTNALSKVTKFQYDEAGNLTNQVDALNRSTRFEYDSVGRRTKQILPGSQTNWLVYDAVGNLIRHTNFNQVILTNAYDSMNRLLNKSTTNGTVLVNYLYSKTGLRTNMTDASGTYGYIYDDRDRLKTNTTPQGTLYYAYDLSGNLTNLVSTTANGVSIAYQYDVLNRLTNAIDNRLTGTKNTAYTFDGVGNLRTLTYPNGITNLWQYDSLNRLTNLTWKLNGAQRGDFIYKLGPAGNRTMLSDNVGGTIRTNTWGYDNLYRLTSEVVTNASPTGNLGYAYDDVGNRTGRTGTLGSLAATNNTFDVNDWLDNDSVTNNANPYFDANGNTRTNGANIYLYDWANRLTNANSGAVVIVYDGDGNRVKKITSSATNLYLVSTVNPSAYAQVVEEFAVAGAGGATNLSRVYTYGLDLISQREASSGTVYFFGYDGLGSTRFLLNNTGGIAESYAYDAFGTLIASNTTPSTVYLYTGEQWDNDLGFYYLRARLMNPSNGRFLTMDTFEGNQSDPLSLHKYLYAHANTVNRSDPSGHFSFVEVLSTAFISGFIAAIATPYTANAPGPNDPTYPAVTGEEIMANFTLGFITGGTISVGNQGARAFLSRRLRAPVASYNETLGQTVLKGVPDDAYVHFTMSEKRPGILVEGLKYEEGGIGTHLFKAEEVKGWTITQARAAIGDLAGSSRANAVAIVSREVAEAAALGEFEKFGGVWTEYVTRQQGLRVVEVRVVSGR